MCSHKRGLSHKTKREKEWLQKLRLLPLLRCRLKEYSTNTIRQSKLSYVLDWFVLDCFFVMFFVDDCCCDQTIISPMKCMCVPYEWISQLLLQQKCVQMSRKYIAKVHISPNLSLCPASPTLLITNKKLPEAQRTRGFSSFTKVTAFK